MVTAVQDIPHKGFSYVTLENTDEERVKRLIFTLNSIKFKGRALKIAVAKKEWQQTWTERQESDVKTEEERIRIAQRKMERRAAAKLLPPPTAVSTASAFDDETFKPSNPYGWMKVKGRYVAIFRAPKKGREGGVLIEPKSRAHLIQPILCHVKPIRIANILTELPEDALDEDEEHTNSRKEEVDRWASGLIKQRRAEGRSIADYSTFHTGSDDSDGESGGKKKKSNGRKRADSDSDDFEVVGGSDNSDDDSDADSYADSFSDIEEIAGVKGKKKQSNTQESKAGTSSSNKPGSVSAVDSQSKMLSVIDSILKRRQGSDYGDSDSQDFEANPSSGESSSNSDDDAEDQSSDSEEKVKAAKSRSNARVVSLSSSAAQRATRNGNEDGEVDDEEDDDEPTSDDGTSSDSSEISAKAFSDDDEDGAQGGVVDFDSDDDGAQVEQPVESMDVDSSGEEDSEGSPLNNAPHAARSSDDADSTDSSETSEEDLQVDMQVDEKDDDESAEEEKQIFEAESASESSQFEDEEPSSESEEIYDAEESRNALKSLARGVSGPERLKVVKDDSDDDIGLNIYSSAPAPKPAAPRPSIKTVIGPERLKVTADDSDDDIGLNIYSSAPAPKAPAPKPSITSAINKVIGPERIKVAAEDSDDDIGLNIFSSAPKPQAHVIPKEVTPKPQIKPKEPSLPVASSPAKPENAKKRKRNRKREIEALSSDSSDSDASSDSSEDGPATLTPSWSADLVAENKKYAYSELVREQDEKIFAAMRDDVTSVKPVVKTFSFLSSASEPEEKKEAPLTSANSFLDLLPSLSSASSSNVSKSLLGSLGTKKPSTIADGDESKAVAAPKIERSKMSLFGGLSSPSKSSSQNGSKPASSTSSSFVRTTEVDRINKLWGSTKNAQRQLAERNHKVATKRVKPSK